MPVALAVQRVDVSRRRKTLTIEVTLSGNYVTNGDAVDLTAMTFILRPGLKDLQFHGCTKPAPKPSPEVTGTVVFTSGSVFSHDAIAMERNLWDKRPHLKPPVDPDWHSNVSRSLSSLTKFVNASTTLGTAIFAGLCLAIGKSR